MKCFRFLKYKKVSIIGHFLLFVVFIIFFVKGTIGEFWYFVIVV